MTTRRPTKLVHEDAFVAAVLVDRSRSTRLLAGRGIGCTSVTVSSGGGGPVLALFSLSSQRAR